MELLTLFLVFLKIGVTTFGGGYAMIPLLQEEVISRGWLTSEKFMDLLAVSESTPGPIAVNMATFVGSSQCGILGALIATLGVVLPSFIIILLIVAIAKNLLKLGGVKAFLIGVRPVVVALICFTAVSMFITIIIGLNVVGYVMTFNWRYLVVFCSVAVVSILYKVIFKKNLSAIILICISAGLGMLLFGVLG